MFFTVLADISVRFTPTKTSSYERVNYDLPFTDYNSSELVQTKSPHQRNLQGSYAKKIGNSIRPHNQILLDSWEEKKTSDWKCNTKF
jgi:hypothetical protein